MVEIPTRKRAVQDPNPVLTATPAATYEAALDRLIASYRAIPPQATVRLAKRTSNLFRNRQSTTVPGLDVSGLGGVLAIDPVGMTADVGGMCTYERPGGGDAAVRARPAGRAATQDDHRRRRGHRRRHRVDVVPQRPAHDDIVEMDVLTGGGEVVTVSPGPQHADLFYGFPNSYGTLGYATRLRVRLERVKPFVALRHLRFDDVTDLQAAMIAIVDSRRTRRRDGRLSRRRRFQPRRELLDARHSHRWARPDQRLHRQQIYYRSIRERATDRLTISRLPVAVGHRLVLVLQGFRRATAVGAAAVAEAAAPQFVLLEAGGAGPPVRHRRPAGSAAPPAAAGAGGPGHRGPGGPDRGVRRTGSWTPSRSSRSGCARCDCRRIRVATATSPGRCTRSRPGRPTSTSVSGPRCRAVQVSRKALPTG